MRRITAWSGWCGIAGIVLACGLADPAAGIYLDEDQNISLRARIYSQASVRTEDSQVDTVPEAKIGQVVSQRNFFNPELEAKLASYVGSAADDLSFRVAGWAFYDGVYDYGPQQFNTSQRLINANYPDPTIHQNAFYLEGSAFDPSAATCLPNPPAGSNKPACNTVQGMFPGVQVQNPRDIYGHRQRVNELYLSYSKGPFFLRVGRQAISWGESDTVALLDANNPFDLTLAAPGVFEDIDEARIPLWTVRSSMTLFDNLGPLSSGFIEAYWVPGDLDNNVGILPMLTASPYSPRGQDPQTIVQTTTGGILPAQFVLFDKVPKKNFEHSRYGIRLQTVVNGKYTVSGWMYTTTNGQPAPVSEGLVKTNQTVQGQDVSLFVTETVHKLEQVYGLSNTFFLEPLDGIIRMEAEFFQHEAMFTPERNLGINQATKANPLSLLTNCSGGKCSDTPANLVRWELGYDRFFFFRPANPSNSFTWVTALVGAWNLDETKYKDFRFGQQKANAMGTSPDDYVQQKKVEVFGQTHLQTDYLHGRLTPQATVIANVRGTYVLLPQVTYRMYDWLLFDLYFAHIGGEYQQLGFFEDRDQLAARMTYQLN